MKYVTGHLLGIINYQPSYFIVDLTFKGILATPPKATHPPRNKGLIRPY